MRLRYLNLLLAKVIGADITQNVLRGKSDRNSVRVRQLDFLLSLKLGKNVPVKTMVATASYANNLHHMVNTFHASSSDNSPHMRAREFHRASRTLISHLLDFDNPGAGMFGKTVAFLATVEHWVANGLVLRMLLWTDNVHHPLTIGCEAAVVYERFYISERSIERAEDNGAPGRMATGGASHLLDCHTMGSSKRALVQHEQQNFHRALQGPYTAEIALAMTSINYLEGATWRDKIIAAARCIIRTRSWTESEQVRLLCFGGDGYQLHKFHAFDMEGLESVLTTVHQLSGLVHLKTELLLTCCVMQGKTLGGLKTGSGLHETRGWFLEMESAGIHVGSGRRWARGTVETGRRQHLDATADRRVTLPN